MYVPISYAENCDRDSCICSIHDDFVQIAEERITNAITHDERKEQIIEEFELELVDLGYINDDVNELDGEGEDINDASVIGGIGEGDDISGETTELEEEKILCSFGKDEDGVTQFAELNELSYELFCLGEGGRQQ